MIFSIFLEIDNQHSYYRDIGANAQLCQAHEANFVQEEKDRRI